MLVLTLGAVGEYWQRPQETFICGRGSPSLLLQPDPKVQSVWTALTMAPEPALVVIESAACAATKSAGTHVMLW